MYIDENTEIHIDIWKTMKMKSDFKFVRELAQILRGDEVLRDKSLNVIRANKGIQEGLVLASHAFVQDCLKG